MLDTNSNSAAEFEGKRKKQRRKERQITAPAFVNKRVKLSPTEAEAFRPSSGDEGRTKQAHVQVCVKSYLLDKQGVSLFLSSLWHAGE